MSVRERQFRIEKRSRALAMMLLTRREELLIEEVQNDIGLDYLVRFHSKGKEGLREFGVELRAVWTAVTKEHADKVLRPAVQQVQRYGPFSRPVCLFFFTMENDGAWYTWVAEPVRPEDGKALLRLCEEPDCGELDQKGLSEIIEQVDAWYDALFPILNVNGPGSKAGREAGRRSSGTP